MHRPYYHTQLATIWDAGIINMFIVFLYSPLSPPEKTHDLSQTWPVHQNNLAARRTL